jgi:hypothetical protein
MFPARGRVAVFEAPRDASSPEARQLDSCQRRSEPDPEVVCIDKSDTSRDTSDEEWDGCLIIDVEATPAKPEGGGCHVLAMRLRRRPEIRGAT